jgi:hypothetical protein
MSDYKSIRQELIDAISIDGIMEEMKAISRNYPWRLSGTEMAAKAADYFAYRLNEIGLKPEILTTKGFLNVPKPAALHVEYPFKAEIHCAACAQCGSTPPGGLTSEVVFVGSGAEEDYIGKDVKGKIVLAELSFAPPRPEKAHIAFLNGAAGMLLMNYGSDNSEYLGYGTVKSVWGNPTPENIDFMVSMPPVVMTTKKDGLRLYDALQKEGKLVVTLKTQSSRDWMDIYIPYAEVKAERGNGDFILCAHHMDSWGEGACDNAIANAVYFELARVLNENKNLLKRDVRFAFWQGHENGIMEGSSWFVDQFWDELDEHCAAVFTFDTWGMAGSSIWHNEMSTEMREWISSLDDEVIGNSSKRDYARLRHIGDMSFMGIGIPASFNWMQHTKEEIAAWGNATFGEYYHSEADTAEFIDKDVVTKCMRYGCSAVVDLALTPVLPMSFAPVADEILERLDSLNQIIAGRGDAKRLLELDQAEKLTKQFREKALLLEEKRKSAAQDPGAGAAAMDSVLKRLSRTLMPLTSTVGGRFAQDNYGLTALNYVMPCSDSIRTLVQYPENSHEYYLWSTVARRSRNMISDTLRHAMDICSEIL